MEAFKVIFSRRSIRRYKDESISNETIVNIIKAAMQAPSARNLKPWQFIAINKKEIMKDLANIHPNGKMLVEAAFAILVCGDKNIDDTESYLIQNCAAATQNMLLASYDLGIGSVWLGVHPRKERMEGIKQYFNLPQNIIPISLISFGIPDETKYPEDRYDSTKIRFNQW